jgi:hypothetical protein
MITSNSKNNSFICVDKISSQQIEHCLECSAPEERQASALKQYLYDLWSGIRLFLGTDRWGRSVTLQRGDSHYTMKMDEIEARWRNQK